MKKLSSILVASIIVLIATGSFASTAKISNGQFVIENYTKSLLPYVSPPESKGFPAEGFRSTIGKPPIIVTLDKNIDSDAVKIGDSKGSCTIIFNTKKWHYANTTSQGDLRCEGDDKLITIRREDD